MCGGNWRMDVFQFTCGAGPKTTPPAGPPLNPDLVNPCLDTSQPYHLQPWCNASLGVEDRITDALQRMTVDEKVDNLGTGNARAPSLGLPWYGWGAEATHGVAGFKACAPTAQETNFAFPITTAM